MNDNDLKPMAPPRPMLRLVQGDGSHPPAPRNGLSEAEMRMRWYARHIREFRDHVIDFAEERPKLTLVHSA